jgi:hypothetical protein
MEPVGRVRRVSLTGKLLFVDGSISGSGHYFSRRSHRSAACPLCAPESGHKRKATERIDQSQSLRFEPRCSRSSERYSNSKRPALQVVAVAWTFLNYTKMTKYEALEKNAISALKIAQLGNLKYSRISRKASLYWEILGLFIDGKIGWPV